MIVKARILCFDLREKSSFERNSSIIIICQSVASWPVHFIESNSFIESVSDCDAMECSTPGSSVHVIRQKEYLKRLFIEGKLFLESLDFLVFYFLL